MVDGIGGTAKVMSVRVAIGYGSTNLAESVYIDSIAINSTLYDLEPRVVNATSSGGYNTIQDAIDAATTGDTITVAAGTYAESVVIDKSLVLEGANAGVLATEARVPESVIDAGEALVAVLADGAWTVGIDGFTINNFGKAGLVVKNALAVQIDNNIVSTTIHTAAPNGIQVGYVMDYTATTGTISGNQVSSCTWDGYNPEETYDVPPDNWTGSGILVIAPNSELEISHNEVSGNDVGLDIEAGPLTFAENNDVHDNSYGFVLWNADSAINFNAIYDNGLVSVYRTVQGYTTGELNAENNWWGQSSGPGEAIGGTGDVDAEPWLLSADGDPVDTTYAKYTYVPAGWSLTSPDRAWAAWATVGTDYVLSYNLGAYGTPVQTSLSPLAAIYVKTNNGGFVMANYPENDLGMYSTNLEAGWNLISVPMTDADSEAILSPIRYGTNNEVALTTLVSQGNYNPSGESFYESMLDIEAGVPDLYPNDGYWAYMNVAKEFGVVKVELW